MRASFLAFSAVLAAIVDGSPPSSFPRDALCGTSRDNVALCQERDLSRSADGLQTADSGQGTAATPWGNGTANGSEGTAAAAGSDGDELAARIVDLFDALRAYYQPEAETDDVFKGRGKKKKYKKNKMGMMMGVAAMGMTVIGGMFTKMMMGGVTMIAVKALIIAKLALLLASVIALKKLIGGGGGFGGGGGGIGSGSMWNSGGGGGVEAGGYRRSYGVQQADDAVAAEHSLSAANALAYKDQLQVGHGYGRSNVPRL